jgi:3-methyladenine DNA glycosylase/8-oxoguanine DNA glycosylase
MAHFNYGHKEIDHLKRRDKKLGLAIDSIGMIEREITPDLFTALVKSIVSQQISNKAAQTLWRRLSEMLLEISPENIARFDITEIQQCGLSMRKSGYIKSLADKTLSSEIDFLALTTMPDSEFIKYLSKLHGIGTWTAEMLLIFSLERPNVLSWGDFAIRRGIMNLYEIKELDKQQFEYYRKRYSPYCSVASFYLWAIA